MIQRNEKIPMLLDWRNFNIIKMAILQSKLQILCNSYQIAHDTFHRTRTNNRKMYMET